MATTPPTDGRLVTTGDAAALVETVRERLTAIRQAAEPSDSTSPELDRSTAVEQLMLVLAGESIGTVSTALSEVGVSVDDIDGLAESFASYANFVAKSLGACAAVAVKLTPLVQGGGNIGLAALKSMQLKDPAVLSSVASMAEAGLAHGEPPIRDEAAKLALYLLKSLGARLIPLIREAVSDGDTRVAALQTAMFPVQVAEHGH